jgi:hypothetical protein
MPLTLPKLDDRTYADLIAEAQALIPSLYPEWTDHNPSDPGITLIELLAWLSEMLLYRADQVPDRHRLVFLRLLNGPEPGASLIAAADVDAAVRSQLLDLLYKPAGATIEQERAFEAIQRNPPPGLVEEAVRVTVVGLRSRDRAVTAQDFVALARAASPDIARVLCLARRDLDGGNEAARIANRPGHVSVLIVPQVYGVTDRTLEALKAAGLPDDLLTRLGALKGQEITGDVAFDTALRETIGDTRAVQLKAQIARLAHVALPQPAAGLRQRVWNYLDDRRALTTRHHVTGPFYVPIAVEVLIARRADTRDDQVSSAVKQAIVDFLHPLHGGPDGRGWPFGRDIYVSELYELLESVSGVDYVPDIGLASACGAGDASCIVAAQTWHDSGDLIGIALEAHHLPGVQTEQIRVDTAAGYVPVRLQVRVQLAAGADPALVRRAIKNALRRRFSPRRNDPDGQNLDGTRNWAVVRDIISIGDLNKLRTQATVITFESLRTLLRQLPGVQSVAELLLQSDTAWIVRDSLERDVGIGSRRAEELADVQVDVEVTA